MAITWKKLAFADDVKVIDKEGVIYNSAGVPNAALNVIIWRAPYACTLTRIYGYRVGGTGATVNARRNAGGTKHLGTDLSLSSADTWVDGGASYSDTAYAAGDKCEIMVVSTAGTVTQLAILVQFTKT
ncbi:MAG: hypothetical protein ACOYOS_00165 [Syntrophales bacterium]